MSELIMQGALISVVGYVIVFAVLTIIWGVLEFSKLFFIKGEKPKEKAADLDTAPVATPSVAPLAAATEDEDELIAVLTAAVAAAMGRQNTYNLNIKSYRRVGSSSPAWNKISRQENLSN